MEECLRNFALQVSKTYQLSFRFRQRVKCPETFPSSFHRMLDIDRTERGTQARRSSNIVHPHLALECEHIPLAPITGVDDVDVLSQVNRAVSYTSSTINPGNPDPARISRIVQGQSGSWKPGSGSDPDCQEQSVSGKNPDPEPGSGKIRSGCPTLVWGWGIEAVSDLESSKLHLDFEFVRVCD